MLYSTGTLYQGAEELLHCGICAVPVPRHQEDGRTHLRQRHSPGHSEVPVSVADPDPPDPHVFGPPGSGSTSQMNGSGSFNHHEK